MLVLGVVRLQTQHEDFLTNEYSLGQYMSWEGAVGCLLQWGKSSRGGCMGFSARLVATSPNSLVFLPVTNLEFSEVRPIRHCLTPPYGMV